MSRFRHAIGICLLLLVGVPSAAFSRDVGAALAGKWTATQPPINFAHIETGEINRHGEAVGYHHRPNGIDPPGARVLRITQPPDANGIYSARVALRDPATGEWIDKRASSTFFPDAMSDDEVIEAVLAAFHNGRRRGNGEFIGASGHGFMIEGWYQSGRIAATYPLRGP
ncbi:MAG: EndoU domain-containing protein [Alphaproteobacteria bacterium]|nr:EndoU domain-containing protein [Alphaproteobacteria bacterium]